MKWTKFDDDFEEGGPLYSLSEENKGSSYEQREKEEINKTCFKIYHHKRSKFIDEYLYKEGTRQKMEIGKHYHKWVSHKELPKAYFDPKYFEKEYLREIGYTEEPVDDKGDVRPHPYEIFIGGLLHFYDSEVQCGNSDHAVYFDWDYTQRSVTVYILQLKAEFAKRWTVYVDINPPGSQDPPPPKGPPPPYC